MKCFLTRFMNFCPKLVLTFLLNGGLYQIIFRFFRVGCCLAGVGLGSVYDSSCLYPLAARASWYSGLALSNSAFDDEILESLLFMDIGNCFSTAGG